MFVPPSSLSRRRSATSDSKRRINSRNKGNTYERWLASFFRQQLGFTHCKTSRQASRLMDNCGIDFVMLPFHGSAKTGYKKNRPKPEEIFTYIQRQLQANFPPHDPVHDKPVFLFHKLDGRSAANHIVSMTFDDWVKLIKCVKEI